MANADMNRLMDNARINLPGALDGAIKLELFAILNEFFQESNIWTEDIDVTVNPTNDTYLENPAAYTYDIAPADGGVINRLIWVVDMNGTPQAATMEIPGTLVIQYPPSETKTFRVRVGKTVTDPVTRDEY